MPRYSASKICSLVKKLGRSKPKIINSYGLLVEDEDDAKAMPSPRRGYVPMYVGKEAKRYEVPIKFLSSPTLQQLLMQSQEDDLETNIGGPIMIGCTTEMFEQILKVARHH